MTQFLRALLLLTALLLVASAVEGRRGRFRIKIRRSRRPKPVVKIHPVNAVGRVTCDGEPIPNVHLRLMKSGSARRNQLGFGRTDENGAFNISGKFRKFRGRRSKISRNPQPYVRVGYSFPSANGSLKVVGIVRRFRKFFKFIRNENSKVMPYNSSGIDFGTINFTSIFCRAYLRFYEALQLFHTRAPTLALPYSTLFVVTGISVRRRLPLTNVIKLPQMFQNLTAEIANHDFAHTFRQSYDGSYLHFISDVKRFNYTLHQACENKTNEGNAFNEGWAEYWADSCNGSYGNNTQDYTIEGNVANALRALQNNCTSTYYQMVNVLKQNKMTIHSFQSFNQQHGMLYNCTLSS